MENAGLNHQIAIVFGSATAEYHPIIGGVSVIESITNVIFE